MMIAALSQNAKFESMWQLFTVTVIFAVVLGVTYFTTKWLAQLQKSQSYNKNIEVIETFKITSNKFLQIVRTGEKYLVIAIGKDTVTMLTEIDKEQLDLLKTEASRQESFSDILNRIKNIKHKK